MRIHCYLKIDNKLGLFVEKLSCLGVLLLLLFGIFICQSLDDTRGNIFAWRPLTALWRGHRVQLRYCDLQTKAESKRAQGLPYL